MALPIVPILMALGRMALPRLLGAAATTTTTSTVANTAIKGAGLASSLLNLAESKSGGGGGTSQVSNEIVKTMATQPSVKGGLFSAASASTPSVKGGLFSSAKDLLDLKEDKPKDKEKSSIIESQQFNKVAMSIATMFGGGSLPTALAGLGKTPMGKIALGWSGSAISSGLSALAGKEGRTISSVAAQTIALVDDVYNAPEPKADYTGGGGAGGRLYGGSTGGSSDPQVVALLTDIRALLSKPATMRYGAING